MRFLIILILFSFGLKAQISSFNFNGRWGFKNEKGDTISSALFQSYEKLNDSINFVKNGYGWHLLHPNGYIDYGVWYRSVQPILNNRVIVELPDYSKYRILTADLRPEYSFDFAKVYSYPVKNYFILERIPDSSETKTLLKEFYVFDFGYILRFKTKAYSISEQIGPYGSFFVVNVRGGKQLLNNKGEQMVDGYFDEIEYKEGRPWFIGSGNSLKGVYSLNGKTIIQPNYRKITESSDSAFSINAKLFAVKISDKSTLLLDTNNFPVLKIPYEVDDFFNEGIIISEEKTVIRKKIEHYESFSGLLGWDLQVKISPVLQNIYRVNGTPYFLTEEKGSQGRLVNGNGKELCPLVITYAERAPMKDFLLLMDKRERYRLFNEKTSEVLPLVFDGFEISDFSSDSLVRYHEFMSGDKIGLLDDHANLLISAEYEDYEFHSGLKVSALKYGKNEEEVWYYYDFRISSKPLFVYNEWYDEDEKGLLVMKNGKNNSEEYYRIEKNGFAIRVVKP